MLYYSNKCQSQRVSFTEAMIRSEAADGGLYLPEKLPVLPKAFLNNISGMTLKDISFVINNMLFGNDIPSRTLLDICNDTSKVQMPVRQLEPGIYVMETFHGPTQNIKDFGAGFFSRILGSIHNDATEPLNVLVATNGHSGCSIARALHDVPGINVFILYPKGLSRAYYDTITSMGDNVYAIEVAGSIDNCLSIVAKAFEDPELNETLTSANSANIGFLLPSVSIYFYAYSQLLALTERPGDIYMSIPTGHGGNLLAAYIAKHMGLPVNKLIAACNANGGFYRFVTTGDMRQHTHRRTLAYGMDSPVTANLPRFAELCGHDINALHRDIDSAVCSDVDIAAIINDVYERTGYLLDPHSAVGYKCLKEKIPAGATGLFIATGHPAKCTDIIHKVNRGKLKVPFHLDKKYCSRPLATIAPTYAAFKKLFKYCIEDIRLRNIV